MVSNDDVLFPVEKNNLQPIMAEILSIATGVQGKIEFIVPAGKRWVVQLAFVSCTASATYLRIYLRDIAAPNVKLVDVESKYSALFESKSRIAVPNGWKISFEASQSSGSDQSMRASLLYEEETEY